jgi:N-acetyltransferase 10
MLKVLEGRDKAWLGAYAEGIIFDHPGLTTDFRRRFSSLLSFEFRKFSSVLSLSVIEAAQAGFKDNQVTRKRKSPLETYL